MKDLHQLVEHITTGDTGTIAPVKGIVKYPLYMGLPATGGVGSILGTDEIMKTVELGWNSAGQKKSAVIGLQESHIRIRPV